MANFYGINNYSNLFSSPISSSQSSPIENLIFNSAASKIYSQTVSKKLQSTMSSYMTSLSQGSFDLKASAKSFISKGTNSSFNQKAVASSDSNSITGTANSNADIKSYTVNVSKLATAQSNTGTALNSNDKSSFTSGLNTVQLKVGNDTKNISFTIDENDTNQSGLKKMANAINYAKSGVTASVATDSKTGTSFIKITSDKTGTDNEFNLSDVNVNAAASSGANSITTKAQNTEYTLEGKQYTSQSNAVSANNDKVQFTLNKADNKDIKLSVNSDTNGIVSDVKDLIESYNNLVNIANSNSSNFAGAQKLKSDLDNIINSQKSSLSNMGVTKNDDGTLSVDSKKLTAAVANNSSGVKDVFSGYTGIAEKLYNKASQIQSNPLQYSKPTDLNSNFGSLYTNNNSINSNSFRSRQNMYSGLVVDTLL